ncbi:MAG: hypothetical protein M3Z17_01005, partial [Gemmatimonadota bacterium]|nr:hypothetical protein [Gemmatimonadota bacterium]
AGATGSKTYSAIGRTVQITTLEVGGRPAVSYVDVPAGASTTIIQPTQIRLTRQAADTAK